MLKNKCKQELRNEQIIIKVHQNGWKMILFLIHVENINNFIMWAENIENLWFAIFAIFVIYNNYNAISFQYLQIYVFLMGWKVMHW